MYSIYSASKYFRSTTMYLKKSFSTSPAKPPATHNQNRRRCTKFFNPNHSLYFIIFLLPITYIFLSIVLPEKKIWFTVFRSSSDLGELITFEIHRDRNQDNPLILSSPSPTEIRLLGTADGRVNVYGDSSAENSSELACVIPKLNPFDKTIKHLMTRTPIVGCTDNFTILFETLENSTITPLTDKIRAEGYKTCCYRTIHRNDTGNTYPDKGYKTSNDCYPLSLENATIANKPKHEFLAIFCNPSNNSNETNSRINASVDTYKGPKIVDMHITVHLKPSVEKRVKGYYNKLSKSKKKKDNVLLESERVNVIILGLDSMSNMNFVRQMPKVHSFLVNNLSAVGMQGFNKIGTNTFPNLAAALTSYNNSEMKKCTKNWLHDKCPFIWKEYAAQGYRTSFAEDTPWMGIFNYNTRKGFKKPPTDYYLRNFQEAADKLIGTHRQLNAFLCHGPRLTSQVLLEYMKKVAWTMGLDRRYFQLVWATALTHSYLNDAKLADEPTFSTLQWFYDKGFLNHTVFILLSDHGMRWGDIKGFVQGHLEDRLPLLYYAFPEWFRQKYSRAYRNLVKNKDKLTTHYDLHQTLADLLDLNSINSDKIGERELKLEETLEKEKKLPRGISHFIPIPKSRTCEMAGVEQDLCTCHHNKMLHKGNPLVQQAANFIVHFINLMISKSAQCAFLALERVKQAMVIGLEFDLKYQLVLQTSPGGAVFEATVKKNKKGKWSVSGTIGRNNLHGNQSHCIKDSKLKLYCYCLDLMIAT